MKRVLVAALHHESNSFNPITTGEKDFTIIRGDDIYHHLNKNDSVSGIIQTLKKACYIIIPTVFARAVPNGEVDYHLYQKLKSEILHMAEAAAREGTIDAITLSLHGSMRVRNMGEAEGDFLRELKALFPQTPVFSSLDMHTTMTDRMHMNCDGFVGYKCAPHTDCFETGEHAGKMTIAAIEHKLKLKSAWVKVPILIAGEQSSTTVEPMIGLIKELRKCERKKGIIAASYLMGFPWADNEDSSVSVYVVADKDRLAQKEALQLAEKFWAKRADFCFQTEAYQEKAALDAAFEAIKNGKLPVYISDSGDNPTAGASSDCTDFLRLVMSDKRTDNLKKPVLYGGIYDPVATKQCEGKIGERITITFGAKFDPSASSPITATGTVKAFIKKRAGGIMESNVALFNSCGVDIVLSNAHIGYTTPELFRDLGADPEDAEIVICKLGYLTHEHSLIAKRSILALTKGNTNEDLKTLDYKKIKRPIFPLDDYFEYDPSRNLKLK